MGNGPLLRYGHTAVKDGDMLVVFGGKHFQHKNDAWRVNISAVREDSIWTVLAQIAKDFVNGRPLTTASHSPCVLYRKIK